MKVDVLVVGAGPVGLAAALFLSRHGLTVRIVDQSDGPTPESRAIGIQARTLEILEMANAVDEFVALGHRLHGVTLYGEHGGKIGRVGFEGLPTRYPYILSLPQSDTERILAAQLGRYGVGVERTTTLRSFSDDGNSITASLRFADGSEGDLVAACLVDADGAHSTVREALGMGFEGKTYDLRFLLADVHVDSPLGDGDAQVFAKTEGLLAIFPLGGGRYRLVADNPPARFSEHERPTLEEWQAIVDRRAGVPMRLTDPNWTAYFRVHSRMVEHLRKGRAFLMGDAAHIHSPALAQGMNTGIHDAWNLAWKLALVQQGAASPGLLDSYEAERLPVERRVLAMTDFTQNVIGTESRVRQVLRDLLLPLATHLPLFRQKAGETVSELSVGYRGSPIVSDHHGGGGVHAGDRAPDAPLVDRLGRETRLASLFGLRHVLLVAGDGSAEKTAEIEKQFGKFLNVYDVAPAGGAACKQGTPAFRAKDAEFGDRYGRRGGYVLVRPDGYVAFRSDAPGPERLLEFLARYLPNGSSCAEWQGPPGPRPTLD